VPYLLESPVARLQAPQRGFVVKSDDRVDTIKAMLALYQEARSVSSGAGGTGGRADSRYLEFDPSTWTREYKELERVLERLRYLAGHGRPMIARNVSSSTAWWNVRQRYLECEKVRRLVHLRKTHSGERVPTGLRQNEEIASRTTILNGSQTSVMVWRWNPKVDLGVVDVAVDWMSSEFRGTPSVYSQDGDRS
jgi:hypothetical protein